MAQALTEYLWPCVEGRLQGAVEADTNSGVTAQLGPRSSWAHRDNGSPKQT